MISHAFCRHELTVATEPEGPAEVHLIIELQPTMSKPGATSEGRKITPVPAAMTSHKKGASPTSKLSPILPKGTIMTPLVRVPHVSVPRPCSGSSASGTSNRSTPVVPVKLWRSPYTAVSDLAPVPVISLERSNPLQHPPGQLKESSGSLPPLQACNESSVRSVAGRNGDTIIVVKKMQDGKAVTMAQPVNSSAALTKALSPSVGSQKHSTSLVSSAVTTTTGCTVKMTQDVTASTSTSSFTKKVSAIGAKTTIKVPVQTGVAHPRVPTNTSPAVKPQRTTTELATPAANTPAAKTVARPLKTAQSKHSPAVIRITPVKSSPSTKTILVVPPQGATKNTNADKKYVPSTACKKPAEVVKLAEKQEKVGGSAEDVKKTHTTAGPVSTPQEDEGGYGIKISSVISLAEQESPDFPAPQESVEDELTDASDTKSGGKSDKVPHPDENKKARSEFEPPLPSSSTLSVGASKTDGNVIELCSFQEKKGNSVFGSQIVFKPTPVAGNKSQGSCASMKLERFLMSFLHRIDCYGRVSEETKKDPKQSLEGHNLLSSTEYQGKQLKTDSNVKTKTEPGTDPVLKPGKRKLEEGPSGENVVHAKSQDSLLKVNGKDRIKAEPGISTDMPPLKVHLGDPQQGSKSSSATDTYKIEHESSHGHTKAHTKTGPELLCHPVPSVRHEDATVQEEDSIPQKPPLRRIVITSDEVPLISSDEVKNGLEAFLQRNNISDNFSKDEIIKLHWDGKDVDTFQFRDVDRELLLQPAVVPPKVVRPAILRCGKVPPAAGNVTNRLATAAEGTSKQTVSETGTPKAEKVVGELMIPGSGSRVPAGFKAVQLRGRTETGEMMECFVLKAMKPIHTINSTAGPEQQQICYLPRAIPLVHGTGEVFKKLVNPKQHIMPVMPSVPAANKSAPVCSASVPRKGILAASHSKPAGPVTSSAAVELARHFVSTRNAASSSLLKRPVVTALPAAPTVHPSSSAKPVAASKVIKIEPAPLVTPGHQSSQAVLAERAVGLAHNSTPPTASKLESSAGADTEKIFEPECLLQVSNNAIDVTSLNVQQMNDDSSSESSSTSSSD
ncbi:hypothetical protein HPB50_016229 [Hyalomma asiaticum]|uniref:Uncharacterized protein n=1 Tax=Hyalomma asiaticum TaxID=266040 RepID=A0ACB7RPE0_HYAAI|nr:hypothetical protein HPB50_016229 [Hyalomma asiaticum]